MLQNVIDTIIQDIMKIKIQEYVSFATFLVFNVNSEQQIINVYLAFIRKKIQTIS